MSLESKLSQYIDNPRDAKTNFQLGVEYYKIEQTTSAFSYFLRAADFDKKNDIAYESLILCALSLMKQTNHDKEVRAMLLHSISINPYRPESYFYLSQFYEWKDDWISAYTWAEVGLSLNDNYKFMYDFGYPGKQGLIFQKARNAWWIGKVEESKELFNRLHDEEYGILRNDYRDLVNNNLTFFNT